MKYQKNLIKKKTCHLVENNLICEQQHGFVPRKCCTTNLLETLDIITKALNDKKIFDIIYTDYSKAFDKVNHRKLQFDLDRIVLWSNLWEIPLNDKKCKVIRYGNSINEPNYQIRRGDGSIFKLSNSFGEKDLGVMISNDLK
ncbi:unnamed protein product [Brachionus calyciflorus]|uniref:Reverse transcriptase domain-containing protein n=1 Tax=Brachionus calyciflorus TaxID=104777 RepID=A0A814K0R8_9BILA|nr:unnamed protein product [Brachionus calyciflorus]